MDFPPIPDVFTDAPRARVFCIPPASAPTINTIDKRDAEQLDYDFDYLRWLARDEAINNVAATIAPVDSIVNVQTKLNANGTIAKLWVTGGVAGMAYMARLMISTTGGRMREEQIMVRVASERVVTGDPDPYAHINNAAGTAALLSFVDTAGVKRGQILMVDGDVWILSNAVYDNDKREFYRVDKTRAAFGLQVQGQNAIPGEEGLGYHTSGTNFWVAQPATYELIRNGGDPANDRYAGIGGWENGFILTSERQFTIGGMGIELDGSGTFPYGRVVHATSIISWARRFTGMVRNIYPDFGGFDDKTADAWLAGVIEQYDVNDDKRPTLPGTEKYLIAALPAGSDGPEDIVELLAAFSDGRVLLGKSPDANDISEQIATTRHVAGKLARASAAEIVGDSSTKLVGVGESWDAAKWVALGNLAGVVSVDASQGFRFYGVLTADVTIQYLNVKNGQPVEVALIQDGTGNHAVTWDARVKFIGAKPTIATDAGGVAVVATVEGTWSDGLLIGSGGKLA